MSQRLVEEKWLAYQAMQLMLRFWNTAGTESYFSERSSILSRILPLLNEAKRKKTLRKLWKRVPKALVILPADGTAPWENVADFSVKLATYASVVEDVREAVARVLAKIVAEQVPTERHPIEDRLEMLGNALSLDPSERLLVRLLYVIHSGHPHLGQFVAAPSLFQVRRLLSVLPDLVDIPAEDVTRLLQKSGRLSQLKLIEFTGATDVPKLNDVIHDMLIGISGKVPFAELFEAVTESGPELGAFGLEDADREVLSALLRDNERGSNILLHGAAGAGKTSVVHALARSEGLTVYKVKNQTKDGVEIRVAALLCAVEVLKNRPDTLILIDEADQLLCTFFAWILYGQRIDKGWLNEFLENGKSKVVWVTNETFGTESSTLRRFAFTLEFKSLTTFERKNVWTHVAKQHGLTESFLGEGEVTALSREFQVNAGPIADAVKRVKQLNLPAGESIRVLRRILERAETALLGEAAALRRKDARGCSTFDLSVLNIDQDPTHVLSTLTAFSSIWTRDQEPSRGPRNLNILLSGPPGTGKTELARHIASHLSRELITKRASDLLSPYIGVTEKKLAAAFREAERDGSLLFLDEADSLLRDRGGAHRSWEVTQTNELLCRMESFRGIFLCATNFVEALDQAAMRRFAFKMRFGYLKDDAKVRLFRRFFADVLPADVIDDDESLKSLSKLELLAPGDFKVAHQKLCFMPERAATMGDAISALALEAASRVGTPRIGFS